MSGLLVDETSYGYSQPHRSEAELAWAEDRVARLGFDKYVDGRVISYLRHLDNIDIYADIRTKGKIEFYIYKLPKQVRAKDTSYDYFTLHDRLVNDIDSKWNELLGSKLKGMGLKGKDR
jgi:hypothetical protein